MNDNFQKVKEYILDLGYNISHEDTEDGVFVITDESSGLNNLVIGVADPLIIMEQFLVELNELDATVYQQLLQKNRDIIHGAFALDESGKRVIFRDTLQVDTLDKNEIEASITSLVLLLSEYSDELIRFANK